MRYAVAGKAVEVFRLHPILVSHFDAIGPAFWEFGKESVQCGNEVTAMFIIRAIEPGELKHEEANMRADRFARFQETPLKNLRIQEMFIRLAGPMPKRGRFGYFFRVISSVTLNPN